MHLLDGSPGLVLPGEQRLSTPTETLAHTAGISAFQRAPGRQSLCGLVVSEQRPNEVPARETRPERNLVPHVLPAGTPATLAFDGDGHSTQSQSAPSPRVTTMRSFTAVHFANAAAANAVVDRWKTVEMCQTCALWTVYNSDAHRALRYGQSSSLVPEFCRCTGGYIRRKMLLFRSYSGHVVQAGYRAQPEPYPR